MSGRRVTTSLKANSAAELTRINDKRLFRCYAGKEGLFELAVSTRLEPAASSVKPEIF